jgi:transposase-like protein
MASISYARHPFPPAIIRHAVWLYLRFSLSYRDVEDLLAERGVDVSYETVRRWVLKFGVPFARELRQRRPRISSQWHLDEVVVVIGGQRFFLWRVVDSEGEVLDLLLQRRRDKAAAVTFLRKLLKKQGFAPDVMVTDRLRSYGAARRRSGFRPATSRACARTTGPKIRISPPGGGSARCSVSSHRDRPSAFLPFMPPFTTRSTFSVISSRAARFAASGRMR